MTRLQRGSGVLLALALAVFSRWTAEAGGPEGSLPFVNGAFTDNMVLQRDVPVPVWGWTQPGEKVTVSFMDKRVEAVADAKGKWMAKIGPLAAGSPFTMSVSGPQAVTFTNVLVGDVWICSGQSNMQMGMGGVSNAVEEIAAANFPRIRLLTVPRVIAAEPESTISGSCWQVCSPATVAGFSAVGFFFGRHLHRELDVPIGLINASWGGTVAEAWTSLEALKAMPDFEKEIGALQQLAEEKRSGGASYVKAMEQWYRKNDKGSAEGGGWEVPGLDDADWRSMALPNPWQKAVLPEAGADDLAALGTEMADEGGADEAQLATFHGVVWFRKAIQVPASWAEKELALHLGPVDDCDTTWFNGTPIGAMDNRVAPRDYKIPGKIVKAGRNVVAVRVLDLGATGGFCGQADQMKLELAGAAGENPLVLAGAWKYRACLPLTQMTPMPQRASGNPNLVTVLYNGMIAPLVPYGVKGAIWYQGEANAGRGLQYRSLLPVMIQDWRSRFGAGDPSTHPGPGFPFLIVQLANFMAVKPEPDESRWAELREAQYLTTKTVPKTALAVAIDIGDAANIHPVNKQDVGLRLALGALAIAYDRKIEYSGPTLAAAEVKDNVIRLRFDHAEGGLVARGEKLQGFAIAGADKKFVWADAVIEKDTVTVSAAAIEKAAYVRYAWADNPICNLYNQAGLPAVPFRTDGD